MKAGFFVMKTKDKQIHISQEYEMMEEFFMRTKIPFEEKEWNINFWDFQIKEEAIYKVMQLRGQTWPQYNAPRNNSVII